MPHTAPHRLCRTRFSGIVSRSSCTLVFSTVIVIACGSRRAAAAAPPPARAPGPATATEIDDAIKKGVAYIYAQQKDGGHWEKDNARAGIAHDWEHNQGDSFGGFTSLATYALLAAGQTPKDKRLANAVEFLKKADVIGIYSLGLRAQVWHLLGDTPKEKQALKEFVDRDADRIVAGINTDGDSRGLWDYGTGIGKRIDHSVSQYGILGLWALEEAGAKVDIRYWRIFDDIWRQAQFPDGGWAYDSTPARKNPHGPIASMTAAGIATLFITQDKTYSDLSEHHGNVFNANIENGLRWMTKHFGEVDTNYAWYGVERIGMASGTKYFGTSDWFEQGAEHLLSSQQKDGRWTVHGVGTDLTDTCFAVLFLSRGRAPIMMNKLHYEFAQKGKAADANWNNRPRDAANLAKWTADQIESNLNWQLVTLDVATEELRDAPILYLGGDQELNFSDSEENKLKTFIQEGGIIVANADYNSKAFDDSFLKLGTKLFGYEFRELPANSPIFHEQIPIPKSKIKVLAMSNGIREMMILMQNGDPARVWQAGASSSAKPEALGLAANIFLYAVDKKNLLSRGQTNLVIPNPKIKNDNAIRIARLQYDGNWDPEPGGWSRLAAIFHNDLQTDLDVKTVKLGDGQLTAAPASANNVKRPSAADIRKIAFKRIPSDQVLATEGDQDKLKVLLDPRIKEVEAELAAEEEKRLAASARYKIANLTGTAALNLSDAQIEELRKFIGSGGTLIADSGGGSAEFSASADKLLRTLFPDSAEAGLSVPLTPDSPLYTLPATRIDSVQYRTFARTIVGGLRAARILGITQNGRIAAYFSKEDLAAGLVGQPMDGIVGYTPESATAIMRNIILTAAPPPPPASAPAPPKARAKK